MDQIEDDECDSSRRPLLAMFKNVSIDAPEAMVTMEVDVSNHAP